LLKKMQFLSRGFAMLAKPFFLWRADVTPKLSCLFSAVVCYLFLLTPGSARAANIAFQEVTAASGIHYSGESKGSDWTDFNGDGFKDLWVTNRYANNALYINNGDGTFTYASGPSASLSPTTYGAAWGDFDNDGDPDVFDMGPGGCSGVCAAGASNALGVNEQGTVVDRVTAFGVAYPDGRGRTPLWFDWNGDGRLDVLAANRERPDGVAPTALFTQVMDGFANDTAAAGITEETAEFAQLARLAPGSEPLLLLGGFRYPIGVYDFRKLPFSDLRESLGLPLTGKLGDAVLADLNGDLLTDIFMTRKKWLAAAEIVNSTQVRARLTIDNSNSGQQAIRFRASGVVQFDIYANLISAADVFVGSSNTLRPGNLHFSLDSVNPDVSGIYPHQPGVDKGVYIGYDSASGLWEVQLSSPGSQIIMLSAAASVPVSDLTTVGFTNADGANSDGALKDLLLLQRPSGGFEDATDSAGLGAAPTPCGPVVAADFDNDGDLDLYMVCLGIVGNRPNILYENLGNGVFVPVPQAGGAEGSMDGTGESVSTVDFDNDGFVDLFVTNGEGGQPFGLGPHQLFRNVGRDRGNRNHWLEIDLEGVESNRDAVGAQVVITAGGVSQVRTQDGGIHLHTQNSERLHFGLASSTRVDKMLIYWPSGLIQELTDIPCDQIIHVVEPSNLSALGRPPFSGGGVYLWKDTFDGPYHLRTQSDGKLHHIDVDVLTDRSFLSVTPRQLEGADSVSSSSNHLALRSEISGFSAQDGVDFELPAGTKGYLAVREEGVPNPRQVFIGKTEKHPMPAGWVLNSDDLPVKPKFVSGRDLGLFLGWEPSVGQVGVRWDGNGNTHSSTFNLISSPLASVTGIGIEPSQDQIVSADNGVAASGLVSTGWDGLDIAIQAGSELGFSYRQDGIVDWRFVNPTTRDLGFPNAYALPLPDIVGPPKYDPAVNKGLFVWRDDADVWHVRATSGSPSVTRYTGAIVGSAPIKSAHGVDLESSDTLDVSTPGRIAFNLSLQGQWQDGFDFSFPPGTQISLELNDNSSSAAKLVILGAAGWRISRLPVVLSADTNTMPFP
jgi:hypothetical protein